MPLRRTSLLLAGAAALAVAWACDSQPTDQTPGGGDQAPEPALGTSSAAATAGSPLCTALGALPQQQGNLVGWLQSVPIAAAHSEGFKEPATAQLDAFQSAFEQLLEAGPTAAVAQAFGALSYELLAFTHETGAKFVVLQEKTPRTGGGTFVINVSPARDVWLEAPHADFDEGTLHQAAQELVTLGARALLLTGANRCANELPTPCDGKTPVCGGQLRQSDSAHYDRAFFTAAHKALRKLYPNALAVSLHGMDTAGAEAAVIGDGTGAPNTASLSLKVRDALNQQLGQGAGPKAFSCNDPGDAGKFRTLCGTTNVQGRFDNGSADACKTPASTASGHFLHIEQDAQRRSAGSPDVTGAALAEVIPCSLGGNGIGCPATPPVCQ